MKLCPKCNAPHDKSGKFCSRKCANSRQWNDDDKLKKSLAAKGQVPRNKGKTSKIVKRCLECKTEFSCYPSSEKIYCSGKCNPNVGGYREGSGRAKTGYYKGIYCGSTYELVWVIYQLDNNISFDRFPTTLEYDGRKYIPDFLQYGKIVEIKGYEAATSVQLKTEVANKNGYEVTVLRKENLKAEFNWVKSHYIYKRLEELYDGFKPKHSYVCRCCNKEFHRHRDVDVERAACSRSCSMKMNRMKSKLTNRKKTT